MCYTYNIKTTALVHGSGRKIDKFKLGNIFNLEH